MRFDVVVIGGGIVGLASSYALLKKRPGTKLVILEKENGVSRHQTGHNSGVIHSGIYYKPGSLKAINCIKGYQMLLEFCDENNIAYDLCGKVIVATEEHELPYLNLLLERGKENGLEGIKMLTGDEIREIEPHCAGISGIKVPQTGIIDYMEVSVKLREKIIEMGGEFHFGKKVTAIKKNDNGYTVQAKNDIETSHILNCAGLYSDKIARMEFGTIDSKIIPFRGEYYMLNKEAHHLVKHLIYPVPDPNFPFLGVHFTRMINGHIEAGPNAVLAFAREGYTKSDVNIAELLETLTWPGFIKVARKYWKTGFGEMYRSFSKSAFTKALQRLIPELNEKDLETAPAGVRAQACLVDGSLLDDFKIIQSDRSLHVINAPSPAATSSLSIGDSVADQLISKMN